eukprot:6192320-Pleurochrysis_carterae.AAC.1
MSSRRAQSDHTSPRLHRRSSCGSDTSSSAPRSTAHHKTHRTARRLCRHQPVQRICTQPAHPRRRGRTDTDGKRTCHSARRHTFLNTKSSMPRTAGPAMGRSEHLRRDSRMSLAGALISMPA